jgi:hypothetical protein
MRLAIQVAPSFPFKQPVLVTRARRGTLAAATGLHRGTLSVGTRATEVQREGAHAVVGR